MGRPVSRRVGVPEARSAWPGGRLGAWLPGRGEQRQRRGRDGMGCAGVQEQVCKGARASRAAAVMLKVSLLLSGADGRLHRRRPVLQPSTAPEQLSPLSHGWWRIQPALPPGLSAAGWEPALSQGHCSQICSPQKGKEIFPSMPNGLWCICSVSSVSLTP